MLKKILQYSSLLIILLIALRLGQVYLDRQYNGIRLPYLQMLGPNQVTIKWQTLNKQPSMINYGTNAEQLNLSNRPTNLTKKHQITLKNLSANTKYWYRINDIKYSFITAPEKNSQQNLWFWVLGDPGDASPTLLKIRKTGKLWFAQRKLDLLLTTGDNAYVSGTNQEYQAAIFEVFGDLLTKVNFWPAYGNHDARRQAYFDIFNFPQNGELGGVASDTEDYFSFDYGQVHLIFLNSETHPLMPSQTMLDWLELDLTNHRQQWTLVLFHSPPYTKGSHNSDSWWDSLGRMTYMREQVLPILDKHNVDLVLAGHSHAYERSHLIRCHYQDSFTFNQSMVVDGDGIYQKTDNNFGGSIYAVVGSSSKVNLGEFNHPALPITYATTGSLMLNITTEQLTGYFVNENYQVLDTFIISKTTNNLPALNSHHKCNTL